MAGIEQMTSCFNKLVGTSKVWAGCHARRYLKFDGWLEVVICVSLTVSLGENKHSCLLTPLTSSRIFYKYFCFNELVWLWKPSEVWKSPGIKVARCISVCMCFFFVFFMSYNSDKSFVLIYWQTLQTVDRFFVRAKRCYFTSRVYQYNFLHIQIV